jgi:hypothetical protein
VMRSLVALAFVSAARAQNQRAAPTTSWVAFASSLPVRVHHFNRNCCSSDDGQGSVAGVCPLPWGPGSAPTLCQCPARSCSLACANSLYRLVTHVFLNCAQRGLRENGGRGDGG